MILNYDFTFLAILLSSEAEEETDCARCPVSPLKKRSFRCSTPAMELAADESVILAWWQLKDGAADPGLGKRVLCRALLLLLRSAYRKAARLRPEFDRRTREQLKALSELEAADSGSMDAAADTFAQLLAAAADTVDVETHRRVLRQMLYHLGRWIYLIDAADDLKDDLKTGAYNPLIARFSPENGELSPEKREEFEHTLDHSIHAIAAAYELWEFGCWSEILKATIYSGLFQVGKAVLDGNFSPGFLGKKRNKTVEETA